MTLFFSPFFLLFKSGKQLVKGLIFWLTSTAFVKLRNLHCQKVIRKKEKDIKNSSLSACPACLPLALLQFDALNSCSSNCQIIKCLCLKVLFYIQSSLSSEWWFAVSTTAHQRSTSWADCCWWDNWEISTSNDLSLEGHWPIGRFLCQATHRLRDINPLGSFYVKWPVTQGTWTHWEISMLSDLSLKGH